MTTPFGMRMEGSAIGPRTFLAAIALQALIRNRVNGSHEDLARSAVHFADEVLDQLSVEQDWHKK